MRRRQPAEEDCIEYVSFPSVPKMSLHLYHQIMRRPKWDCASAISCRCECIVSITGDNDSFVDGSVCCFLSFEALRHPSFHSHTFIIFALFASLSEI